MEELLKDLMGLGFKDTGDEDLDEGGVPLHCTWCEDRLLGACEHDCATAILRYIAQKLTEQRYVKVPEVVHCSRCGELPRFYLIEYRDGVIGWACNCELCGYGSLSGMRNIKAAIDRWNEWNDQEQQDAWAGSRAKIHEEEQREKDSWVKVVKCKDCTIKEHHEPGMVWCPLVLGSWIGEEEYCSRGTRDGTKVQCGHCLRQISPLVAIPNCVDATGEEYDYLCESCYNDLDAEKLQDEPKEGK